MHPSGRTPYLTPMHRCSPCVRGARPLGGSNEPAAAISLEQHASACHRKKHVGAGGTSTTAGYTATHTYTPAHRLAYDLNPKPESNPQILIHIPTQTHPHPPTHKRTQTRTHVKPERLNPTETLNRERETVNHKPKTPNPKLSPKL